MAKTYPRARAMGESVREVIARILTDEISDPRLHLVTVTGVQLSPDLRHANVFIAVHGDEERETEALVGLESAKGHIRSLLSAQMTTRYSPELHFRIDSAIDEASRISDAIRHEHELGRAGNESADGADDDV